MKVQGDRGVDLGKTDLSPAGFGQAGSRHHEEARFSKTSCCLCGEPVDLLGWHGSVLCRPLPYRRSSYVLP